MKRCRAFLLLLLAALTASAGGRSVPSTAADTLLLDEITVTAIKQGADSSSLALGATVIAAEQAQQAHAVSPKTLAPLVPNLFMPDYGSRITSTIYARGIGSRIDQPAVGVTVDNVPLMSKEHYDADLPDISRVEVLPGPQGLLFGRNTMGGVVNIHTLSPLVYTGTRLLAEGGSRGTWRVAAGHYARPRHALALAATAQYAATDGQWRNDYTGHLIDWERAGTVRLKAEWLPTSTLVLSNVLAFGATRQGGYPYEYTVTGVISRDDTCCYRRTTLTDGLTVTCRLPAFTLSGITSYQLLDDRMNLDQDFLPLPYFTLEQSRREHAFTQDLVARNGEGRYRWLTGLFAFYRRLHMDAPVTFKDTGIAELIEGHRNAAVPSYPIEWDTRQFTLGSHFYYPLYGFAAYHQSTFTLGNVELRAGLRLNYEHSALHYHSTTHTGYSVIEAATGTLYAHESIDIDNEGSLSQHHFDVLPQVSAMWHRPGRALSRLGLQIARGTKAGGFNTQMFSDVLQQQLMTMMGIGPRYKVDQIVSYKPESAWTIEAGAHLDLAAGAVQADLTAFLIHCRDQQLTVFPDGTTTGRVMTNAGRTRSYGVEATVSAQPANAATLRLSYGLTHATFLDYNDGRADYSGRRVPYVPAHTLYAEATYRLDLCWRLLRSLTARADLRAAGSIYWNEANTEQQPFYALLGASLTAQLPADCELEIWGNNLTATRYATFYFKSIGHEFLQRGNGRRLGATLRINI